MGPAYCQDTEAGIAVNQYLSNFCSMKLADDGIGIRLVQKTGYPWRERGR
jgi:DUF1680 family protein